MKDQQKLELNLLDGLLEGNLSGPEPFRYDEGESRLENEAPLLQGSRCNSSSARVASQVLLGHEMGRTMGVTGKTSVGDPYLYIKKKDEHRNSLMIGPTPRSTYLGCQVSPLAGASSLPTNKQPKRQAPPALRPERCLDDQCGLP